MQINSKQRQIRTVLRNDNPLLREVTDLVMADNALFAEPWPP